MKKSKNNKQQLPEVPKAPKTIKVKTLVILTIWLVTLGAAAYGGWSFKSYDYNRVNTEATQIANKLKENQ